VVLTTFHWCLQLHRGTRLCWLPVVPFRDFQDSSITRLSHRTVGTAGLQHLTGTVSGHIRYSLSLFYCLLGSGDDLTRCSSLTTATCHGSQNDLAVWWSFSLSKGAQPLQQSRGRRYTRSHSMCGRSLRRSPPGPTLRVSVSRRHIFFQWSDRSSIESWCSNLVYVHRLGPYWLGTKSSRAVSLSSHSTHVNTASSAAMAGHHWQGHNCSSTWTPLRI
jgi:hypothetical protein